MNQNQLSVPEIQLLAYEYYALGNVIYGSPLHIVLDDGNVENRHILICLRQAIDEKDWKAVEIGVQMLGLSPKQRREVYTGRPR